MLTEKERKWLENRKIRCSRCVHYEVSGVGGICFWCADREKFETSAYTLASDYRDAAYIVAACNAVPRLIEMVQDMSSVIAGMPGMESTPDEILQDFFEATEPEE